MVGATAALTYDISFRLPFGSVCTSQATETFSDSRSTTESKLINAWPSFLRDHARRLVHLSRVLTNAERSSISADLDKLTTNGKYCTPLSVVSSGTALGCRLFRLYRPYRNNLLHSSTVSIFP
jgi:hypothetical protein